MSITLSLRERKKQRTAEDLYEAALDLFASRSYDEVTVEEICERAEVSRATFFRYYGAKSGLIMAFNRRVADLVATRLQTMAESTATEQLWAVQDECAQAWTGTGAAVRAMARDFVGWASPASPGAEPPYPELVALVRDVIAAGQRAGEFDDTHAPAFVATMIMGVFAGITVHWLKEEDDARLGRATHDALDLLISGLARSAPPRATTTNRRKS